MFKSPHLTKSLLLLAAGCVLTFTAKAGGADTTVRKNATPPTRGTYDFAVGLAAYQDAIKAFKADSMDKGLHLLVPMFRQAERANHFTRTASYAQLAVYHFILDAEEGRLNAGERKLIGELIKDGINRDAEDFKKVREGVDKVPQTPFIARFKLFILFADGDEKAGKAAEKILKYTPDDIPVNTLMAEWLYNNDKYEQSAGYCSKLITLSPQDVYAVELRGKNYDMLEKYDDAIADYDEVIKSSPNNKLVYYHRSIALINLDKYKEAVPGLLTTYNLNPEYIWTCYYLAKCYDKLNMADSALYFVNLHLQQHPDDDDGYDLKGTIYYDKSDYANAVDQFNQAIRINPKGLTFYEDRGDAYYYDHKYQEALADFLKAVALDKHRTYAMDRTGDCYYQMKDYQKAISYEEAAIKTDASYKYAYVDLSRSKVETGDFNGAIAACKKALAIDSTYDSALGDLGWAYYCAGDNDACIAWSYKALHYDDGATYAMFNIALATLKKGDPQKARMLYKQFIDECKAKGYKIEDGAVDDLMNLMKKNIAVDDCKYIIEHLFEKPLE